MRVIIKSKKVANSKRKYRYVTRKELSFKLLIQHNKQTKLEAARINKYKNKLSVKTRLENYDETLFDAFTPTNSFTDMLFNGRIDMGERFRFYPVKWKNYPIKNFFK